MKISELLRKDIRAKIEFGEDVIIVKNPGGQFLNKLKKILKENLENEKSEERNKEILVTLIENLTNIEIDENLDEVLENPSHELSVVVFHLCSIIQELTFEIIAEYQLGSRLLQNTILEKETLTRISQLDELAKEIAKRELAENGEEKEK
jgi:hypothetical protein